MVHEIPHVYYDWMRVDKRISPYAACLLYISKDNHKGCLCVERSALVVLHLLCACVTLKWIHSGESYFGCGPSNNREMHVEKPSQKKMKKLQAYIYITLILNA